MARRRRPGLRGKLRRALDHIDSLLAQKGLDQSAIERLRGVIVDRSDDDTSLLRNRVLWRTEERDSWREKADWWKEKSYAVLDEMTASRRTARIVAAVAAIVAVVMAGCVLHLRHELTVHTAQTREVPAR